MKFKSFALVGAACVLLTANCGGGEGASLKIRKDLNSSEVVAKLGVARMVIRDQGSLGSTTHIQLNSVRALNRNAQNNSENISEACSGTPGDPSGSVSVAGNYSGNGSGDFEVTFDECRRLEQYQDVNGSCEIETELDGVAACSFNAQAKTARCATALECSGLTYVIGNQSYVIGFSVSTDGDGDIDAKVCVNGTRFDIDDLREDVDFETNQVCSASSVSSGSQTSSGSSSSSSSSSNYQWSYQEETSWHTESHWSETWSWSWND